MTFDQALAVVQIADTGSFRAAALALHKAQSAVSYAVRTLEDELGVSIFDRSQYRPQLTSEGAAIVAKCRALLTSVREIQDMGQQFRQGVEAEVRLAISALCPLELVIPVMRTFSAEFPATTLRLLVSSMNEPEEDLLNRKVDIALATKFSWDEAIGSLPWGSVAMLPVCAPEYAAAKVDARAPFAALQPFTQVVVTSARPLRTDVSAGILAGTNQWRVTDFSAKRALLIAGLGWGNMPAHQVAADLEQARLIQLPQAPTITADLQLMRRQHEAAGPASERLWHLLSECS